MKNKPSLTANNANSLNMTSLLRGFSFIFLIMALLSAFLFYREYLVYQVGKKAYASIADTVIMETGSPESEDPTAQAFSERPVVNPTGRASSSDKNGPAANLLANQVDYQRVSKVIKVNFDRLTGINPDAVG